MLSKSELVAEIEKSFTKGLVFLTGAGVSNPEPSSLPLAREINREIFALLFGLANLDDLSPNLETRVMNEIQNVPMEHIWEQLIRVLGTSVLESLKIFDAKKPTRDHFFIARLSTSNKAPFLLTLNFDPLHEISIEMTYGQTPQYLSEDKDYRDHRRKLTSEEPRSLIPIVGHLHGSIWSSPTSLVSTIGSVGLGLSRQKEQVLSHLIERHDLFCAGYSDEDSDVLPIIAESPNKLYWYLFSGELPPKIAALQAEIKDRFILITRGEDERGLSDTILNLPLRSRKHLVSSIEQYQYYEDNGAHHEAISQKLGEIRRLLSSKFSSNKVLRIGQARLVLAAMCDDTGERDLAYEMLKDQEPVKDTNFNFTYALRLGHLLERKGNVHKALKLYGKAKANHVDNSKDAIARLAISSARLGLWKLGPWRVFNLVIWMIEQRKLIGNENVFALRRVLWEYGDFLQHISEYLLFPSAALIYIFGRIPNQLLVVVAILDRVCIVVFGWLREKLLYKAALRYTEMARAGLNSINDESPEFTGLGLLRLSEVLSALGKISQAKYMFRHLASRGTRFFEWSQSEHGTANGTCAHGIIDYYAGNNRRAEKFLSQAKAAYGSHKSGQIKAAIYLFRLDWW